MVSAVFHSPTEASDALRADAVSIKPNATAVMPTEPT